MLYPSVTCVFLGVLDPYDDHDDAARWALKIPS